MPLQHINDRMLKLMNRRHTRHETETIIARLRATIPGLVLRTTFIVGFPGETEAEFAELVEFVAATRFERLGAFTYSFEPDTPAAKLPDHLPDEVKEERRDRLMAVQQPIAFAFNQSLVGRTLDVLIDAPAPEGKNLWLGRTYADAPDVDGVTWVRGTHFKPGDLVECEIVGAEEHDLIARPVSTSPPEKAQGPAPAPAQAAVSRWRSSMACRRSHSAGMPTFAACVSLSVVPASRVSLMSRTEDRFAMVAPAPRRFWNVPNTLTVSRLVLAVCVFVLIDYQSLLWALALFVIAAVTDALDGYFARLLKQDTPIGRQLDPLIDKVIVVGLLHLPGHDSRHRGHALDGHGDRRPRAVDPGFAQPPGRPGAGVRGSDGGQAQDGRSVPVDLGRACSVWASSLLPSPALLWVRDVLTWLAVALTLYSGLSYIWIAFPKLRGEA